MKAKTQTVWPNTIQNITWFEFWHPAQAAALSAEEKQNRDIMRYNYIQDMLEASTSESLTDKDNQKFIVIMAIIAVTMVIISLN